jgi:2-polyprenyl-3-methyl-5-hydroxy-6-metoxy-1,4-benzoquinol methylase
MRIIPRDGIAVSSSSYVDPNGFLFEYEGRIFRAVRPDASALYRNLIEDGDVRGLVEGHHLVPTVLRGDLVLEGNERGLVLEHERVEPLTYCVEWPGAMLRAAALATLDLAIEVAGRGLILQDAYPWNVLFRGTRPVFVDFTSLVPAPRSPIWPAVEQYEAFFGRPLRLMGWGKAAIARKLMLNNVEGVTFDEYCLHVPALARIGSPATIINQWINGYVQRHPAAKRRMLEFARRNMPEVTPQARIGFLRKLRRTVEGVAFTRTSGDVWGAYYAEIPASVDRSRKLQAVGEILAGLKPQTVTDLGCNEGVFSLLAARQGAGRVVSVDISETCLNRLYAAAERESLPITPVISDLVAPTPAFGFLGEQYPPLFARVRSDTVLCLALMHHLHVRGRQSFERIASLLERVAQRHVIFEYVDMADDNLDLIGAGREIRYDLDLVKQALARYFPSIQAFASDRPTRTLLLCSRS